MQITIKMTEAIEFQKNMGIENINPKNMRFTPITNFIHHRVICGDYSLDNKWHTHNSCRVGCNEGDVTLLQISKFVNLVIINKDYSYKPVVIEFVINDNGILKRARLVKSNSEKTAFWRYSSIQNAKKKIWALFKDPEVIFTLEVDEQSCVHL